MDDNDIHEGKIASITASVPDTSPVFYSNHIQVTASPWDMRLQFCQIDDVRPPVGDEDIRLTYKNVATVYLAPGQARALHRVLTVQLSQYEALWAKQNAIIDTVGNPG